MNKSSNIERKISIAMRIGVSIATAVMIFGFVLLLVFYEKNFAGYTTFDLTKIIEGLAILNPYSYMFLGIFLLILTPVLRVIASIILFAKEKDKLYTAITILVLLILCLSFFVGFSIY